MNLRRVVDSHGPGTTYCIHAGTYNVGADSLLIQNGDRLVGDPVTTAPAPEGGLGKVLTSVPTKIVGHSALAVLFVQPGARATLENLDVSGAVVRRTDAFFGGVGVWLSGGTLRRSRIHDIEVPISMTGTLTSQVRVDPGDWIFGDEDGVLVIPKDALDEVLAKSEEAKDIEDKVRTEVQAGIPVIDVYNKYGRL
jgi:hypothetical protein